MIPKLHAKGSSFKGIAAYVLHDKNRAKTATRVAWAETRNLATDNPHVAWKVMAATAMDQERLKEQAGVKKTGRKSFDAVLHFTLSWHPEEKENLNREEMIRAANQAIRALKASELQAMIVCHDDEPQKHVHVILNRVSPEDGRMLSSSKEKLELSKWAEAYEKERGFVYCEERVLNNQARARDEYTRGRKDKARNIFEAEAANDNAPHAMAMREQQRRKDAALEKKARAGKERHRQAWELLQQAHKNRVKEIKAKARFDAEAQRAAVREKHKPHWTMLFHEHQAQERDFERREETFLGRFKNVLGTVDLQAIIHGKAAGQEGHTRGQAVSEAFKALASSGARHEALKRQQEAGKRDLQRRQKLEETQAVGKIAATREEALKKTRSGFEKQRNDLILTQNMDGAKLRAERMARNEQRGQAWEDYRTKKLKFAPKAPGIEPVIKEEISIEGSHAPDRFETGDSIKRRFERSAGDRFERKPDRDRD